MHTFDLQFLLRMTDTTFSVPYFMLGPEATVCVWLNSLWLWGESESTEQRERNAKGIL